MSWVFLLYTKNTGRLGGPRQEKKPITTPQTHQTTLQCPSSWPLQNCASCGIWCRNSSDRPLNHNNLLSLDRYSLPLASSRKKSRLTHLGTSGTINIRASEQGQMIRKKKLIWLQANLDTGANFGMMAQSFIPALKKRPADHNSR